MTQEEKAERYDKSFERASNLHKDAVEMENGVITKTCEIIFPTLAESEDEKIRKDILAFIRREGQHIDKYKWHKWTAWLEKQGKHLENYDKDMLGAIEYCKKNNRPLEKEHIAWLEKQGQVKESLISQHENKICKENDDSLTSEDEKIRKAVIDFFSRGAGNGEQTNGVWDKDILVWLEKQSERSPLSKDEEYTLARIIEYLEDNDCPSEWKGLLYDVYALPYQKEQTPANKVMYQ